MICRCISYLQEAKVCSLLEAAESALVESHFNVNPFSGSSLDNSISSTLGESGPLVPTIFGQDSASSSRRASGHTVSTNFVQGSCRRLFEGDSCRPLSIVDEDSWHSSVREPEPVSSNFSRNPSVPTGLQDSGFSVQTSKDDSLSESSSLNSSFSSAHSQIFGISRENTVYRRQQHQQQQQQLPGRSLTSSGTLAGEETVPMRRGRPTKNRASIELTRDFVKLGESLSRSNTGKGSPL